MKTVILDLLDITNNNIEHIENRYPAIREVINQINTLLNNNPSNREILEWMLSNQEAIENINECINSINKS